MSSDILFRLQNINHFFLNEKKDKIPILQIQNLEIKKNQFTAIIGNSGSGKTTLLELLGAMNQTTEGSIIYQPDSPEEADYKKLWECPALHHQFLLQKVAFAFQQANLISYFNVLENIAITNVVSQNVSLESAKQKIINSNVLNYLNIDELQSKSIETISGGQQQRVALARTANSGFEVFFADEPTGNVGQQNEHVIFQFLRELVDKHQKSVVIVTHNIKKALEYADELVIISHKEAYGKIENANHLVIHRSKNDKYANFPAEENLYPVKKKLYEQHTSQICTEIINPDLIQRISEIMSDDMQPISLHHFQSTEPQPIHFEMTKAKKNKKKFSFLNRISQYFQILISFLSFLFIPLFMRLFTCSNQHFARAFIQKDLSKYYKNKQLSFFTIIFLSLLAISLFNSWHKILFERLNNPFVNILLVKNNAGKSFTEIKNSLLEEEFKTTFSVEEVSPVRSVSLRFLFNRQQDEFLYVSGRSLASDNPILKELQPVQPHDSVSEKALGLFVTAKFLEQLQYEQDIRYIAVSIGNKINYIPIIGIYQFLPGDTYLITNTFFQILQSGGYYQQAFDRITITDKKGRNISELLPQIQALNSRFPDEFFRAFSRDSMITITFSKEHNRAFLDSILIHIKNLSKDFDFIPYFQPNLENPDDSKEMTDSDWFFLHRKTIRKAEELKTALGEKGLQTDLEKISTQKDFHLISRMLNAAIFLLILLTFISTLIYIRYSFYLHFYQQRTQVGIIKSLGVSNATFAYIFRLELLTYLISIYLLSLLAILILQTANIVLIKMGFLSYLYLQVFAVSSVLQIVIIFASSLFSLEFVLQKILYRTIGDLIYDRKLDEI
jgi:putative ABC transport system ATP-binding protein